MFTIPKHGWVLINIGSFSDRASYLTEVPLDCLDSIIYALENKTDFIVSFDAEGWSFKIISDYYRTFIIEEKDFPKLLTLENINKEMLAKEIYQDISENIDNWSNWSCSIENEEDILNYKKELNIKLEKLKSLI